MMTPGKHWHNVNVLTAKHPIRVSKKLVFVVPLLDRTGVRYTANIIKERIDKKKSANVLVTGDPGTGKSTLVLEIAKAVDPKFSVDDVAFWLEDFEELFQTHPVGGGGVYPQIILDEAAHELYGPEFLTYEQRVVTKNLTISRAQRQIVYFVTPRRSLLNPHVRNMMHLWIDVSEPRDFVTGYARVWYPPSRMQSPFAKQKMWSPQYAFIFPELSGRLWDEYEAKKRQFIIDALDKDQGTGRDVKMIVGLYERGWTQQQIAELCKCSVMTISRILSKVRKKDNNKDGSVLAVNNFAPSENSLAPSYTRTTGTEVLD